MVPEIDQQQLAQMRASAAVMVVDRSGGRSAQATRMLLGAGIRAVNVRGGTAAWIQAGQPVEHGIGTEATR